MHSGVRSSSSVGSDRSPKATVQGLYLELAANETFST